MKRFALLMALISIFSLSAYAACDGTDSSLTTTDLVSNITITPVISTCATNASCAVSVETLSADYGDSLTTVTYTSTTCTEQTQIFTDFSIPWETVDGVTADALNDEVLGGADNDVIFAVGTVQNGANVSDMLIRAYNASTGSVLWSRVASISGDQIGVSIDWESTAGVVAVGQNASKTILYNLDANGAYVCSLSIGDEGTSSFNVQDVRLSSSTNAYVVGNISGTDGYVAAVALPTCALSAFRNISGSAAGAEGLFEAEIDSAGNASVVGMYQNISGGAFALEAEFNSALAISHFNGISVGLDATNDTFKTVAVNSDNSIVVAGMLGSDPGVCAFDSFGAALWAGTCRVYNDYDAGQWNDAQIYSNNVFLGGYQHNTIPTEGGGEASDTLMGRYNALTGTAMWVKENNITTEANTDYISALTVVTSTVPVQIIGTGLGDSTGWITMSRDYANGNLQFVHRYLDTASVGNDIIISNYDVFVAGNGTTTVLDLIPIATTATPEFSTWTLLLAVFVVGGFLVFVIRKKK